MTGARGDVPVPVAIVDDHELIREGLRALLERNAPDGFAVGYCGGSVADAIACRPAVCLLDVDLGPDSAPCAESTAALVAAGVAVLLMSALDVRISAAIEAGALGYVPKSVSYEHLVAALNAVHRGELHLTAELAGALTASDRRRPVLSDRELQALRLYAAGSKVATVGRQMGVSGHTAKEYLDRVRAKYQRVGRDVRTRTDLYAAAIEDGLLAQPANRAVPLPGDGSVSDTAASTDQH